MPASSPQQKVPLLLSGFRLSTPGLKAGLEPAPCALSAALPTELLHNPLVLTPAGIVSNTAVLTVPPDVSTRRPA